MGRDARRPCEARLSVEVADASSAHGASSFRFPAACSANDSGPRDQPGPESFVEVAGIEPAESLVEPLVEARDLR